LSDLRLTLPPSPGFVKNEARIPPVFCWKIRLDFGYCLGVMRMPPMNIARTVGSLCLVAASAAMAAVFAGGTRTSAQAQNQAPTPPPAQPGHGMGKLVIWGDLALFTPPEAPDNCILTNRFKKGQKVGFRMTAMDGGSAETENSATLTVHLNYGGKTVDAPMRWRGAAGANSPAPRGYLRTPVELWTGSWVVPNDAPTGRITYTVTGTDKFGRTASFRPFSAEASQLVIVP
jgi:hypothetical protein